MLPNEYMRRYLNSSKVKGNMTDCYVLLQIVFVVFIMVYILEALISFAVSGLLNRSKKRR